MSSKLAVLLNALGLYAISGMLAFAFHWQFAYGELPCPLCLLQRVAFTALAVGPVLTIRLGPRPQHYGLVIIAALLGALIAGRQMLLHVTPGDPGYGSAVLGLHFYTWAFLAFAAALLAAGLMLAFSRQQTAAEHVPSRGLIENAAVWLVLALTALNALGALLECGFSGCPANPVRYELLG